MIWRYRKGEGLDLVEAEEEELQQALGAIRGLGRSGHRHAATTAGCLQAGLEARFLPEAVVLSLSAWCDSEGTYSSGVEPARALSRALFSGRVLPRLTSARDQKVNAAAARSCLQRFLQHPPAGTRAAAAPAAPIGLPTDIRFPAGTLGSGKAPARLPRQVPIVGTGGEAIETLEEWFRYAPSAGGTAHWRDGRSAKKRAGLATGRRRPIRSPAPKASPDFLAARTNWSVVTG